MEFLEVVSRWIHIGTAIVLVGGSVFMRFILMPAAEELPEDQHIALKGRVMNRWKRFVHTGMLLFICSGMYNYMKAMPFHKGDKLYHPLIGTKILLALGVFYIVSALVGRSAKTENMRKNSKKWIGIALMLSAIIVGISGYARVALKPTSTPPAENSAEVSLEEDEAPVYSLDDDSSEEDDAPTFEDDKPAEKEAN